MKRYNLINNVMGWLIFLVAAVTYLLTIEPTASFWDCPEFIAQGYKLEIGHPPGNPMFILGARFAANFAGIVYAGSELSEDGKLYYGDYLEVVLYKNGVNVWRMWHRDGTVTWKKLMSVEFPVTHGDVHHLSAEVTGDRLNIEVDGRKMSLLVDDLYPSFHLGINACEGINRFYDMDIEGENI